MAIRLRITNEGLTALDDANTDPEVGDAYLSDAAHLALAKFFGVERKVPAVYL